MTFNDLIPRGGRGGDCSWRRRGGPGVPPKQAGAGSFSGVSGACFHLPY